jgi:hypothetical protein
MAHVFDLADAKLLIKAGVEGFMHSVRDQEVDEEYVQLAKEHDIWINSTSAVSTATHSSAAMAVRTGSTSGLSARPSRRR